MPCTRCGILRAMFATNYVAGTDGEAFVDDGRCVSCRHGKRPSAQVTWQGDVKALLIRLNARPSKKKGVK